MMKKNLLIGAGLLVLFVIFTILVKTVDVKTIGRQGTDVGMATVNEAFRNATGYHKNLYRATEVVGYLAFAVIAVFGLIGLWQLIQRKSLWKVDRDILVLGGFYVVVLGCYVLFEKLVINYRPICDGDETLEASYPSSHTLLFVAVMATAIMQIAKRVRKMQMRAVLMVACVMVGGFVIIGRAMCGVHWLTDIIGGLILAAALVWLYYALALADSKGACYPDSYGKDNRADRRNHINCVYAGPEPRRDDTYMQDVYAGPAAPDSDVKDKADV